MMREDYISEGCFFGPYPLILLRVEVFSRVMWKYKRHTNLLFIFFVYIFGQMIRRLFDILIFIAFFLWVSFFFAYRLLHCRCLSPLHFCIILNSSTSIADHKQMQVVAAQVFFNKLGISTAIK